MPGQMSLDGFFPEEPVGAWNCLVACEESQAVTKELRILGHRAFSCDLQECSGGHPEWHIKGDCIPLLNGNCNFVTCDGAEHEQAGKWDLIIAHPPCTYLTVTGNRWFNVERYGEKALERERERDEAAAFFMRFVNADCPRIAIENPVGVMSREYKKPTQIIQPWQFGEKASKTTCLWLIGLEPLMPIVTKRPELEWHYWVDGKTGELKRQPKWYYEALGKCKTQKERSRVRSKTFPGIAKAMAEQWTKEVTDEKV